MRSTEKPVTTEMVWREIEHRTFAVLSYVTPAGHPRATGVLYGLADDAVYVVKRPGSMPLLFESRRMSTMPKKIDDELKARAVRLVQDHRGQYSSLTAASAVVAKQLGVGKESVRRWALQAEIDDGRRHGPTSEELAEIEALKVRTVGCARTWRSFAGLQLSSSGNSTPATADHGVHRHHEKPGPRGRVDLSGAA